MRTLDPRSWIASDDLGSSRFNRYEFVLFMDRNEHVAGARVINGIARTSPRLEGLYWNHQLGHYSPSGIAGVRVYRET